VKLGFVPPFKACGQNDTTDEATEAGFDTTYIADWGGFVTNFTLIFMDFVEGCTAPCTEADLWLEIHSIPEDEEMHLVLGAANYTFDVFNITKTVADYDATTDILLDGAFAMSAAMLETWDGALHFSSPGTYTIGLYVECPKTTCFPGGLVAEKVQSFVAHQDKDAAKIIIEEKWNLISLPLHPYDTSLTSLMAAWDLDAGAPGTDLVSIHHFDQCTDTWSVYGNGQTSLSTMEAGKSYWMRMIYPAPSYTLWVWGTARPMPPDAPAVYTMCDGWNMFGFTSLVDKNSDAYLWNFGGAGEPPYPLIYKWANTGTWTTSGWELVDPTVPDGMDVGEGFWGYFAAGGNIVP
jgi:hypothetical protein